MTSKGHKVLVQGNFDVLHPGHIRLLKFAKECGDKLIVAVNSDKAMLVQSRLDEIHRLEMVRSLECVDYAYITDRSPHEEILCNKPDIVVKGKEFESRLNSELSALESYGGKLLFGSGEFETNVEQFIKKPNEIGRAFDFSEARNFAKRHKVTLKKINVCLAKLKKLRIVVIGEVIVDEYIQGTAIGLSQEDPTIVMTPTRKDTFLGGAAITAGHIKSIGAQHVSLVSVLGEDSSADYANRQIHNYNVTPFFYTDVSRPTPLKTRYRASNKTLLRVNQVRQHKISFELQKMILERLKSELARTDLLVFSDFNYGLLPQSLVDEIIQLCNSHNIPMVADSQTSSQVGDISRYKNMQLITPTEKEVRVALNNPDDGLVILAQKLTKIAKPQNLVITLAEEGVFIHLPTDNFNNWENDRLPAINRNAKDPAGAGDCFLAASSLLLAAGADAWTAFYVGSIAAACQVDNLGNTPLELSVLEKAIEDSFK